MVGLVRVLCVHALGWSSCLCWCWQCVELRARMVGFLAVVLPVGSALCGGSCLAYRVRLQDGKSVVSGSDDKTVRVWDAATGKEVQKLEGHSGYVTSVAFSPVRGVERGRVLRAWWARSGWHVCALVGWGM